jgi:hypothetical protein
LLTFTRKQTSHKLQALANCNGLQIETLQLDGNLIEAAGVVEVTLALPFCPLLASISLSSNPIGVSRKNHLYFQAHNGPECKLNTRFLSLLERTWACFSSCAVS